VCHLTAALEQRQPYVSQQLSVLRKAGLVVARRDGSMVFYRISDPHVLAILSIGKELVSPASAAEERMHASRAREIPGCPCPSCQKRKGRSK
jgi:ArsR family transcriptional regulator